MKQLNMKDLGYTGRFETEAAMYGGLFVARVVSQSRDLYRILCENGELMASVSGKFRFETTRLSDFPAVGDFVMIDRETDLNGNAVIHHVLSRKSAFIRKAAGTANDEQIVASNIDTVFLCMSLNHDFNLRRLERYLAISWDSGAIPVVVLTKADLCDHVEQWVAQVESVAIGADILITSSVDEDGYASILKYIEPGQTVAFIGSSGVGKSTLINRLIGREQLDTHEIRADDKGRHTTTRRELIPLENGGMVIDTPGMRELGLENADLSKTFADIEVLAAHCKFRDCTHTKEPGCAVQQAIQEGSLGTDRLASYLKLQKEAQYDGLNFRELEAKKLNEMFKEVGGMKNARKSIREKDKRKLMR
ncbi:ribosome small subunit-dependent GTPase A [Ligaoa zhengdingensis]|uniref:ribosome small subunit-dependent GTPase A n=1 Tax=Ligaoa zhengdingensis TaxID=2763658 RepID=UPI003CCEB72F